MGHSADHSRQRMRKRIEQMQFLLDNFDGPVFDEGGLGGMHTDEDGYCPTGITMAIINYYSHAKELNYTSISSFMARIQGYLPKDLRISTHKSQRQNHRESPLWNPRNINATNLDDIGEETKEYLDLMVDWLSNMKSRCLNDLTFKYVQEGKIQFIEIMKRRWKDVYSEKVEQEVAANVNGDRQINITFEDAKPEDYEH